jgi:hypothetical protein
MSCELEEMQSKGLVHQPYSEEKSSERILAADGEQIRWPWGPTVAVPMPINQGLVA